MCVLRSIKSSFHIVSSSRPASKNSCGTGRDSASWEGLGLRVWLIAREWTS